jgi:hypothetical protein
MKNVLLFPAGRMVLLISLLAFLPAHAADTILIQGTWTKLADRTVSHTMDHSEIVIDGIGQNLDAIRVKVKLGALNLHRCVVHYKNGQQQDIAVLNSIPQGEESKIIELPANNQPVAKLVFTYDTKNRGVQKAEVEIWGRQ